MHRKSVVTLAIGEAALPPGAALFEQHCRRCHSPEAMLDTLRAGSHVDANGRALLTLLQHHGTASVAGDWQIVAWLVAQAETPP